MEEIKTERVSEVLGMIPKTCKTCACYTSFCKKGVFLFKKKRRGICSYLNKKVWQNSTCKYHRLQGELIKIIQQTLRQQL